MAKEEIQEVFPRSSNKTYSLVEIVRGPTTMVDKGPDDTVFAFPVVAILELLLVLSATAVLMLFSLLKNAPLEELANPIITTDPAKAPWYFMGLQEMLEHMHPLLSGIIIPTLAVLFLVAVPYLDHDRTGAGRWFTSPRGKRIVGWTALYALLVMPAFVMLSTTFPPRELLRDVLPPLLTQSVIPGVIMVGLVLLPVLVLWRSKPGQMNTREVMLVLFTMLLVSGVVLTLVGFLFRGPGFELYWPWNMPDGYNPLNNL
jgi:menaquinol-cytochrome c reductase cytochrome b/c subunit